MKTNIKQKKRKKKIKKELKGKTEYECITNIHMIKPNIQSIIKNSFLKDTEQKKFQQNNLLKKQTKKIKNEFDILEENKNELRKYENFFNERGYVF